MAGASSAEIASKPALRIWRAFAVAGLALAILAGFASGTLAVLVRLAGGAPLWTAALAQAHGHVQIYGFAGLMTLGVAQHFVPRLRGVSPPDARLCWLGLSLLGAGLGLRILSQPLLAGGIAIQAGATALAISGMLEVIGGSLLVWALAATLRRPGVTHKRPLRAFTTALVAGLAAYQAALAINLLGTWHAAAGTERRGIVPAPASTALAVLGFYGFLLPIAFAMASRTFPLFFRTQAPRPVLLASALGALALGTVFRTTGMLVSTEPLRAAGEALLGCGLLAGIAALQVFAPRRPLPRDQRSAWLDPLNLLATSAHGWLALAALALLGRLALPRASLVPRSLDLEWHLLGAGYVTLLILAVGSHLLPGFGGQRLRWPRASWALLALGNVAVAGRLALSLAPAAPLAGWLGAIAGPAAMAALLLFALNTRVVGMPRPSRTAFAGRSARSAHR